MKLILNDDLNKSCEYLFGKEVEYIFVSQELKEFAFSERVFLSLIIHFGGEVEEDSSFKNLFVTHFNKLSQSNN